MRQRTLGRWEIEQEPITFPFFTGGDCTKDKARIPTRNLAAQNINYPAADNKWPCETVSVWPPEL